MTDSLPHRFVSEANAAGLGRVWVLGRDAVEQAFATPAPHPELPPPSTHRPDYTRALLLASPGRTLWDNLLATRPPGTPPPDPVDDPLDRHTETVVEALVGLLRADDPGLVALYPFRHPRQLLGFPRLTANHPWSAAAPLGTLVDPVHGPWFAWRALLLTTLALPTTPLPDPSPCVPCMAAAPEGRAPCIRTCPAGAVLAQGFRWETCARHRLADPGCQSDCPARTACPVGSADRYSPEQRHHHYSASLREIRNHLS